MHQYSLSLSFPPSPPLRLFPALPPSRSDRTVLSTSAFTGLCSPLHMNHFMLVTATRGKQKTKRFHSEEAMELAEVTPSSPVYTADWYCRREPTMYLPQGPSWYVAQVLSKKRSWQIKFHGKSLNYACSSRGHVVVMEVEVRTAVCRREGRFCWMCSQPRISILHTFSFFLWIFQACVWNSRTSGD